MAAIDARFRAAIEGMKEAFYVYDSVSKEGETPDLRLVEINGVGAKRLRRSREDCIGMLYTELYSSARSSGLLERFVRVATTGEPFEAEVCATDPTLGTIWVSLRVVALEGGVAITSLDVTERRRIEREREQHAAVLQNMSEGLCLVRGSDGVIIYTNPKFDRMLGYDPGELCGQPVNIVNDAADAVGAQAVTESILAQIRAGGEATYEVRNVRKDGRAIVCRATTSIIRDEEHGEVFLAVQGDITAQKSLQAERDGFFIHSLDMLCVAGFDGYYKQLNPAWTLTLGWTLDELKAKPWLDFVHPEDRASTIAEGAALSRGVATIEFENRYQCKNGDYRILQWRAAPSTTDTLIYAVARDVTQLRDVQQAVQRSLSEKEVLLKEIHHRVKNNLQVISSLLRLHGERITDPVARDAFQDSQDRVRAIALLHEKLYQSKSLSSVDMAEYCESLGATLLRSQGAVTRARVSVDAAGVLLPVDLALPCGLILNELLTNALKHAFPPGTLVAAPEVRVSLSELGPELLTLSVSDNGVGLPPDLGATEPQSLGMHLVRTLAGQLEGTLSVSTHEGTHWSLEFSRQPRETA